MLLVGAAFFGCAIDTTCLSEKDCPCEIECSEGQECSLHRVEISGKFMATQVCTMKNNLSCYSDKDCDLYEGICVNGFCEEHECETLCQSDEFCTFYTDNNEYTCTER